MMRNKYRAFFWRGGIYLLFFVAFFCMFYFGLREVLMGWEAHSPLFRYAPDYVLRYGHEYLNAIFFANAFLVQFAYYPALGAAVCAALFTLLSFCINRLAGGGGQWHALAGFGIAACLLPVFPYTFCVWPLILLAIAAGGLLWRATAPQKAHHIILRVILMIALTYMLRDQAILAWLVYSLIDAMAGRPSKATADGPISTVANATGRPARKLLQAVAYLLGWAALTGIFCLLWRPYTFIPKGLFLAFYVTNAGTAFSAPFSFFCIPGFSLTFSYVGVAAFLLCPLLQGRQAKTRTILSVLVACIGVAGMSLAPLSAHPLTTFFKADRQTRHYQWQEALETLEKDYSRHEGKTEVTHAEVTYQTQLKICLLALRKASDRIFTYNLIAFPMLLPENISNRAEAYSMPPYYVYSGNYSECLHLSYDWCTGENISPAVLSQLITTSVIVDDCLPASKFLYLLNQTLFRQKDVKEYSLQNPTFRRVVERGKKLLPASNYRVDAYSPDKNALSAYVHNPGNALFYEYFINICLGNNNLYGIFAEWDKIKQFYPRHVPRHLQEALLASYNYAPARYLYPQNIDGIEAETWNDYWAFIVDDQAYQNNKMPFEKLERKWRHTYWFYHLYMIRKTL